MVGLFWTWQKEKEKLSLIRIFIWPLKRHLWCSAGNPAISVWNFFFGVLSKESNRTHILTSSKSRWAIFLPCKTNLKIYFEWPLIAAAFFLFLHLKNLVLWLMWGFFVLRHIYCLRRRYTCYNKPKKKASSKMAFERYNKMFFISANWSGNLYELQLVVWSPPKIPKC